MTQRLGAGTVAGRRRALFGLLDADGWSWATVKAFFWFIVLIFTIGYIPDRAYYFTVNRTLDLGILLWSPINFCPPENGDLPCPAPTGAVRRWEVSPGQVALPAGRTNGSVAQVATSVLYIGGSDGATATDTVYVARTVGTGTFDKWTEGPKLPAPRSHAGVAVLTGSVYVLGGLDEKGAPTKTVFVLKPDATTGALGTWKTVDTLALPEARAGAAAGVVADGLVVVGGSDTTGTPTVKTWKATLDTKGVLGPWGSGADLVDPVANAGVVQVGDYLWLVGGRDKNGPAGAVQRGTIAAPAADPLATPVPNPVPVPLQLQRWAVSASWNLPGGRDSATIFTANGSLYAVGGKDASGPRPELYWSVPNATGAIPEWKHLAQTDLPAGGLSGAAPFVTGSNAFLIGGTTRDGLVASTARANLTPGEPFFQLGLVGATVPALRIEGEIGQQLGYLNAAGAATVDFAIMIFIGWAFAHKEQVGAWIERRRGRRRRAG